MAEPSLIAASPLGGYDITIAGRRMAEVTGLALTSIAMPLRGKTRLSKALKEAFGLAMPKPTLSSVSGDRRLIQLTPDQFLLIQTGDGWQVERHVNAALAGAAYTTDQSDVWVAVNLSGPDTRGALERLCPLDLHANAFPRGAAARTSMEHMGVIIMRTGGDEFLLLSASSSARSFCHALETSLRYVA